VLNGVGGGECIVAENVDNALMFEVLKEIRKEQRDQRTLLLLTTERVDKLDRHFEERFLGVERKLLDLQERMSSVKDDLALMIKSELLGALTHFQTKIENYVEQRLAERAE
jgi:hypothetical protein